MIYLLAILWFASGFLAFVLNVIYADKRDFKFPSQNFMWAVVLGVLAPFGWMVFFMEWDRMDFPQITLFKARNK